MMQSRIDVLIEQIKALSGVTKVTFWGKVGGKERIYIDTSKHNGGKHWNGGVGYTMLYVDCATATLKADGCAGAATRDALAETLKNVRDMLIEDERGEV